MEIPSAAQPVPRRAARAARAGFDLLLALALLYVVSLLVASAIDTANRNAEMRIVRSEAHALYDAFQHYFDRNHSYPNAYLDPRFELDTLDPLQKRGYYRGTLAASLSGHRPDAYDSPDDEGTNREFWLEMSLESDPAVRVVVARSDDAPLGGGKWLDGVFLYRDGVLEPL